MASYPLLQVSTSYPFCWRNRTWGLSSSTSSSTQSILTIPNRFWDYKNSDFTIKRKKHALYWVTGGISSAGGASFSRAAAGPGGGIRAERPVRGCGFRDFRLWPGFCGNPYRVGSVHRTPPTEKVKKKLRFVGGNSNKAYICTPNHSDELNFKYHKT